MHCRQKTKGAYVYDSLPGKTPYRRDEKNQIVLMRAESDEDGPAYYEALTRKRLMEMTSKCADVRGALAKQRAATARKFLQERRKDFHGTLVGPSSTVFNRSTVHVQTGLYLEELTSEIEQDDFGTQTDAFLDRPPTPLYVPAKTGIDVATQIYENDLFDFNLEVQPILEVLIGKTIEQALLEVLEEEELADLRYQQEVLQEIHNADLAEVARLEDRNRRYAEEKQRRAKQYEFAAKLAQETADKIAATVFTKSFLSPLLANTYDQLLARGYFYDATEHDIEVNFFEPLLEGVLDSTAHERRARILLDGIIRQATFERHHEFRELARALCEEECLKQVMPKVSDEVSMWIIERGVRMAVQRLELAAAATKSMLETTGTELISEVLEDVALEVQAQKEAEEAAMNAENSEDNY